MAVINIEVPGFERVMGLYKSHLLNRLAFLERLVNETISIGPEYFNDVTRRQRKIVEGRESHPAHICIFSQTVGKDLRISVTPATTRCGVPDGVVIFPPSQFTDQHSSSGDFPVSFYRNGIVGAFYETVLLFYPGQPFKKSIPLSRHISPGQLCNVGIWFRPVQPYEAIRENIPAPRRQKCKFIHQ